MIKESVNRENLFYTIKTIQGRGDGKTDLDFLVPKNLTAQTFQEFSQH